MAITFTYTRSRSFQAVHNPQPNSRHCFVCGLSNPIGLHLRFYQTAPGEVKAEITLPEKYQGYPGIVHGGIVAAMLDEAAGRSFMGDPQAPRFMFTAKLEVRYRQNVPVGQPLRLVGRAGKSRARIATASASLTNQAGEVLAECGALLVDVPDETIENADLEALGWKVYTDEEAAAIEASPTRV
ncbi:MAG: PaaI family thioesterase [Anaerolineales bacterium]|nr:PaaI family thioesterase [Anaerolineales bacterium]